MLGHNFYHQHIRKYVAMFGTLFNDIYIQRDDTEVLKVPITYGPREKFLARLDDPDFRKQAITLPRISFEITSMSYDAARKLNKATKLQYPATSNSTRLQAYNPIPYNINFELSIMVKNAEDGARIIEQILPFFTPDFTPSVILDSSMNLRYDVPLILEGHSIEDTYEGSFETRRALIHTLQFTMKAYILGPVTEAAVIKFANTNLYTPDTVEGASANSSLEIVERVDTQPGLTTTGTPATRIATTATASVSLEVGATGVTDAVIINGGVGYDPDNPPAVTISAPDVGSNTATATVVVTSNFGPVTSITIVNNGEGYTSVPTVTIADPPNKTVAITEVNAADDYGFINTIEPGDLS